MFAPKGYNETERCIIRRYVIVVFALCNWDDVILNGEMVGACIKYCELRNS